METNYDILVHDMAEDLFAFLEKKEDSLDMLRLRQAYEFATEAHKPQKRKSGEPYIQHPLEIAYMLACLNAGPVTICAGFLHDVVLPLGVWGHYIIMEL